MNYLFLNFGVKYSDEMVEKIKNKWLKKKLEALKQCGMNDFFR